MKEIVIDPLGFTKQTEMLLCGLGAKILIKEFKIRNISTDALHKLTKEDFMCLGAEEDLAKHIIDTLSTSKRKIYIKSKPYHRIHDSVEILTLGERHLALIEIFIAYCKLRLRKEKINFFIEPNKPLGASEILCIMIKAALKEINETELRLKELETVITPKNNPRYSYALYYISIGSMCIISCKLLMNKFWS